MLDFEKFVVRHGEYGAQAIVEMLERYEGICITVCASLEERWNWLMKNSLSEQLIAA